MRLIAPTVVTTAISAVSAAHADPNDIVINRTQQTIQASPPAIVLSIMGTGFRTTSRIVLGGYDVTTNNCSTRTATLITCTFSSLSSGEYRLVVSNPPSYKFDVTVLTVPQQGQKGDIGSARPPGRQGVAGLPGLGLEAFQHKGDH